MAFIMGRLKKSGPDEIKAKLIELEEIRSFTKNRFPDHDNNVLWYKIHCHLQLQEDNEALITLSELSRSLDTARARIANPAQRAGLHGQFPNMYRILASLQFDHATPRELLQTIERGKGRFLIETIASAENEGHTIESFAQVVDRLPGIVHKEGIHYLSFLVDRDVIYAVLVSKKGTFTKSRIDISENQLRKWIYYIDPEQWIEKANLFRKSSLRNMAEVLRPLVSWIEPLFDEGLLEKNDHICYCSDGILHLFPLHYITFKDEPLVNRFSVSRIHGAHLLLETLNRKPVKLNRYIAFQVPTQLDLEEKEKIDSFAIAPSWLAQYLEGEAINGIKAEMEKLLRSNFQEKIVHFATHGIFDQNYEENPYKWSGLLLAANGELPEVPGEVRNVDIAHLLSPEKLLENKPNLNNSHVTLQACVSGLSKEGVGHDLLGLDWALMYLGVGSLLSSHWNVDAQISGQFATSFYDRWLMKKRSRAQAWRESVLEILHKPPEGEKNHAYYWAPFSLSGDWR